MVTVAPASGAFGEHAGTDWGAGDGVACGLPMYVESHELTVPTKEVVAGVGVGVGVGLGDGDGVAVLPPPPETGGVLPLPPPPPHAASMAKRTMAMADWRNVGTSGGMVFKRT